MLDQTESISEQTGAPTQAIPQNSPEFPTFEEAQDDNTHATDEFDSVSDRQRCAIELILTGASYSKVAQTLGIDRKTLYFWRMRDPQFRGLLQRRRTETYDCTTDRFRALLSTSLDALEKQVNDRYAPTSLRAARTMLAMARIGQAVATTPDRNEPAADNSRHRPEPQAKSAA